MSVDPPGGPRALPPDEGTAAAPEQPTTPTARPDDAPPATPAPMDLGQIVDAVVALYRRRWALLLGLCAVLEVPATILSGLILLPLPDRLTAIVGFDILDPPTTIDPSRVVAAPTFEQTMGILGPIWLSALVSIIAGTLTTIAVIYAVVRLRLGQEAGVWSTFRAVLRRLVGIILAFAAYTIGLLVLLALAVAVVALPLSLSPGAAGGGPLAFAAILAFSAVLVATVFVSIRWTFWPQAVMIDATGPLGSLGRSWRLVSGSTARVIGYALLFGLAAGIIEGLLAQIGLIAVSTVSSVLSERGAARAPLRRELDLDPAAGAGRAGGHDAAVPRPSRPARRADQRRRLSRTAADWDGAVISGRRGDPASHPAACCGRRRIRAPHRVA